ncbi:MAG: dTDP-4-dehydrorhamnose reductase, partial [Bacteroidetes bacterium]|nr:dTDP-4-dehydrorhamnose reductase [Bacteroidota bacterium]
MNKEKYLILGSNGQLGREFRKQLTEKKIPFFAPPEQEFDITNFEAIASQIEKLSPSVIINCAAYNAVDDAETTPEPAYLINQHAVENLAKGSKNIGAKFVHYSTDYVFDGTKGNLYTEEDLPNPQSVYGNSKLAGEKAIMEITDNYLILRTSWVFGDGRQNFIFKLRQWAEKNSVLKISSDEVSVPTGTADLADITLRALSKQLTGTFHAVNSDYASRYEWGRYVAEILGLKNIIIPVPMSTFQTAAKRPGFSAMFNNKLSEALEYKIPHW